MVPPLRRTLCHLPIRKHYACDFTRRITPHLTGSFTNTIKALLMDQPNPEPSRLTKDITEGAPHTISHAEEAVPQLGTGWEMPIRRQLPLRASTHHHGVPKHYIPRSDVLAMWCDSQ